MPDSLAQNTQPTSTWATRASSQVRDTITALRRRPKLTAVLAAVLVVLLGWAIFGGGSEGAGKPIVATAVRGDIEDSVTALGNLQPSTYVDVGAQVSGQLKELRVDVGDRVEKGDLLAEIDATVLAAKVEAGKAQLQNLQAQLLDKQSTLALNTANAERQTRLKNENANSQTEYDAAQAAMRSSQAQVKAVTAQITQSQSTLAADEATLGYSKIYAPMSGTIASIVAKQGQTLNANQMAPTILQIADLALMTVQTQVSEADIPKLRVGMDAYFTTLGVPNKRWYGKLKQILPTPSVINNVVLYTALFDVENPDGLLMSQMTAQVFFIVAQAHGVVTVPASAVHYTANGRPNVVGSPGSKDRNGGGRSFGGGGRPGFQSKQMARGQNDRPGGFRRRQMANSGDDAPVRPATVTVIDDNGNTKIRNVMAGVTDRVTTEIRSGLMEGEMVVTGIQSAAGERAANRSNFGRQQRQGGFGGPGGFGGGP